jgi:hypothetical protein
VYLAVVCLLGVMPGRMAAAQEAGCEQGRRELADAERQLREWEDYVRKGGPGSGNMNLNQLRSAVQQGRDEYARRCGAGSVQPGNNSATPDDGMAGNGRNAGEDNPWRGSAGNGSDPDNPYADKDGRSGAKASLHGGGGGSAGAGAAEPDNPFASDPGGTATSTAANKEPPRTFEGKPCSYFTKPAVEANGARLNYYAEGAHVCYQDRMYECVGGYWKAWADCGAYDKNSVRHAEDIEKSKINTEIYEKE